MNTEQLPPSRRICAGLQSLADRAFINLQVKSVSTAKACSHYGDTDRAVSVFVGDDGPDLEFDMRAANIDGTLILHRTVGGRVEWRWDNDSTVTSWSRSLSESSSITVGQIQKQVAVILEELWRSEETLSLLRLERWPSDCDGPPEAVAKVREYLVWHECSECLNKIAWRVVDEIAARVLEERGG